MNSVLAILTLSGAAVASGARVQVATGSLLSAYGGEYGYTGLGVYGLYGTDVEVVDLQGDFPDLRHVDTDPESEPEDVVAHIGGPEEPAEVLDPELVDPELEPVEGVEGDLCICTMDYAPVCDPATATTYFNACMAWCDDVAPEDLVDGPCDDCACAAASDPVCSLDTQTEYDNKCVAECAGDSRNLSKGECKSKGCICPAVFDDHVCSFESGITYSSVCEAACAGDDDNLSKGDCGPGCICSAVYDPVCSLDSGTTYGNTCEAACTRDNVILARGECVDHEVRA